MSVGSGLGRVAVFDRGEGARRIARSIRELARAGRAACAVAVHAPRERLARWVRDADEALEAAGSIEDALRAARADSAWLGPAPLAERAAFAEACVRAGVTFAGPAPEALRRLVAPGGLEAIAREAGLSVAGAPAAGARLLEVIVARDAHGRAEVVGVGDASLRLDGVVVLAESPAPALAGAGEAAAREAALRAVSAAGLAGVIAVSLSYDPAARTLALAGFDTAALAGAAVEAATGIDLLRLALALAAGDALPALAPAPGHALAGRILAHDPGAPERHAAGRVELLRLPSDPGVRADAAVEEGDDAPGGDGVLVTLVARGTARAEALARLAQALADADVLVRGSGGGKAWLQGLCARPEVQAGEAATGFVERLVAAGAPLVARRPEVALVAAAITSYEIELDRERVRFIAEARRGRPRVGPSSGRTEELRHGGERHRIGVRQLAPDLYRVTPEGGAAADVRVERLGRLERRLSWPGRRHRILAAVEGAEQLVAVDGVPHLVRREPAGLVVSPMPAVVVAIPVAPGQEVAAGDPIARIESMKVETEVTAPEAGVVREVLAIANAQVDAGAPLVRIEPLGDAGRTPALPIALAGAPSPPSAGADPLSRYLDAVAELRRLLLGFDVAPAEAKRLGATLRELAAVIPHGDPDVLVAEEAALAAFADVHALFSRGRSPDPGGKPPLEDLWRYLHEPEERGAGLGPGFVAMLRRALGHYGLSLEEPGIALERALLRMQKSHERNEAQVALIAGVLERRLEEPRPSTQMEGEPARELLDRLVAVGQERWPPLADVARELRYRRVGQPMFERIRAEAYAQVESDLARLAATGGRDERLVERLVECPQKLATLLVARMPAANPALRRRLVETLLRRYYRFRPLEVTEGLEGDVPCAAAEYVRNGRRTRVLACHATLAETAKAARRLAALVSELPPERDVALELYLWSETPTSAPDALAATLLAALAQAGFARAVRRAAVLVASPQDAAGPGAHAQQHFTFACEGGPGGWREERRYRGVHPMLFRRMQLARLEKFDLERLPSAEDIYLYRGVAKTNPKDERLFAMAEIRDLTPVLDREGRVVRVPHLERMFNEALAGMRLFQARRAPHQRLEWNRVILTVAPPLMLSPDEIRHLASRLAPAAMGLGLEMVLIDARVPDPQTKELKETLLRIFAPDGASGLTIRWEAPTDRPLEPLAEYQQRVIALRRRGLTHPFEVVRTLAPPEGAQTEVPPGEFVEHDLDAQGRLVPVDRPPGKNAANMVVGVVKTFTDRHPEGMTRVVLLGDPSRAMGSLAEPECRRIDAAIALADRMKVPLEWFAVSAGAKISMESGTENMDWISRVLRSIVDFTQRGGEINVVVVGINVGAQPYWNAEATMLMHTRGILVMAPGSAMVLTGKEALEYSGSVSAEDNQGIGGYDRIMGPNGQAQYRAGSLGEAIQILLRHYDHTYVAPGERFPRRAVTADPVTRDVRSYPHGPAGGAGFATVGDVFSAEKNPDRKKPFDIRRVMAACVDQDHAPLERWRDLRGGDTAVVWDAHLGGLPVCLLGIESRPLPRLEFVPADGPDYWSAGTLFPNSSKKIARAVNAASGNRPLVVLANLSGFDGSPESMRRLQLEYGAEIGRAVVNFQGPIVFSVVSRYHGGAFVVFSKALRDEIEVSAVAGARASVIGGAPAAAVVFAREVDTRTRADPRVQEAERAAAAGGAARARLADVVAAVRSEKLGEVGEEFDAIHSVERALKVGSLDRIVAPEELRPYLVDAVERGIARVLAR
jgi:acetyl/propionyl-CoA carboxylase alpha subunit/acetyl-CoA carboxylase carboxyltransferase component